MPPKYKFQEGEKVLCFHGPLIYEAKCLESEVKDKLVRYYVHYAGWNKNWDEWVPEGRVLKFNEANVQKQRELQKAHKANPQKAKKATKPRKSEGGKDADSRASTPSTEVTTTYKARGSSATPSSSQEATSDPPRKKRSRIEAAAESEEHLLSRVEVNVKIPNELKHWLAYDFVLVSEKKKLVSLPAKVTVDQILENFVKHKIATKNSTHGRESTMVETTNGIREYFNATLSTRLLYNFERAQYAEVAQANPDAPMSKIYGAIHLLRLFVKLGGLLAYTPLDEKSIQVLLSHVNELLRYLAQNVSSYFTLQNYSPSSSEYQKKVAA